MANAHHQILIIGGGTAGITVAASLHKRGGKLDMAIVEPSEQHYYQPAFTLVGAGEYKLEDTRRRTDTLVPSGVTLIRAARQRLQARPERGRADQRRHDHL